MKKSSLSPRLLEVVEKRRFRDMGFSLSLLLYSGVRPAEVARLTDADVSWEDRLVIIRAQRCKTGGGRVVLLRAKDCRIPRNWQNCWLALRRAAGFTHWVPDVCRLTFASYHAVHFLNLPELQLEKVHRDLSLQRSRYMAPAARKEARTFWQSCKQNTPITYKDTSAKKISTPIPPKSCLKFFAC